MITIFSRTVNLRSGLKRYMGGIKFIRKKHAFITFMYIHTHTQRNAPSKTQMGIMTFLERCGGVGYGLTFGFT